MADVILQSNSLSSLIRSAQNSGLNDLPSYKMPLAAGNCVSFVEKSLSLTSDLGQATQASGRVYDLALPRKAFLSDTMIQIDYYLSSTVAANNYTIDMPIGLTMLDITVKTASSTIYTQSPFSTLALTYAQTPSKSLAILNLARMLNPVTCLPNNGLGSVVTTPYRSYCPVFAPWSRDPSMRFDTSFLEQLVVSCQVSADSEWGALGLITGVSLKLVNRWNLYDNVARSRWIAGLSSSGSSTQMLYTNNSLERVIIDSQAAFKSMRILTSAPITALYVGLRAPGKIGVQGTVTTGYPGQFVPISAVSLSINGSVLLNQLTVPELSFMVETVSNPSLRLGTYASNVTATLGGNANVVHNSGNGLVYIPFSLLFSQSSMPSVSGLLSSSAVASIELTVWSPFIQSEAVNTLSLYCNCEYLNVISINPSNGSISKILST
jgi:hypothetical protein